MTNIKLLDKSDAEHIRKVTADRAKYTYSHNANIVSLPLFVAYQGDGTIKPATGRATCRLCGNKIAKNYGAQLSFFYDEEQNSWTAKEYHVHADGCPLTFAERNELTKAALARVNSKALNSEVEHFLSVDDDERRPHDYYDAIDQAYALAEYHNERALMTACRKVLIDLGYYKEVSREYLDGITCFSSSTGRTTKGTPNFKLDGKLYLFDNRIDVTDPESGASEND